MLARGWRQVEVHVVPCIVTKPPYDKVDSLINPAVIEDGWAKATLAEHGWTAGGTADSVDTLVNELGGWRMKRELSSRRWQRDWLLWAHRLAGKGMLRPEMPAVLFGTGVSTVDTAIATTSAYSSF
jgi:hypothetical protein